MSHEEAEAGLDWLDDRFFFIRYDDDALPNIQWVLRKAEVAVTRYAAILNRMASCTCFCADLPCFARNDMGLLSLSVHAHPLPGDRQADADTCPYTCLSP